MKSRFLTHMSAVVLGLGLVTAAKANADTVSLQVVNKTPFSFAGGIVRFPSSREYFDIQAAEAGESMTTHNYEGSFFSPSIVVESVNHNKELCYFSGIDDNLVLTISYNGCDAEHPNCVITCNGQPDDEADQPLFDTITVPYSDLVK